MHLKSIVAYMAVNILTDLIGYYVDNEEIIAAIDDIIATIDEQ